MSLQRKNTCGVMVKSQRGWDLVKSSDIYIRQDHRDYSKSKEVIFYNHQMGRCWKGDLSERNWFRNTTVAGLTNEECERLIVGHGRHFPDKYSIEWRILFLRELWSDDKVNKNTEVCVLSFRNLRGKGLKVDWRGLFKGSSGQGGGSQE